MFSYQNSTRFESTDFASVMIDDVGCSGRHQCPQSGLKRMWLWIHSPINPCNWHGLPLTMPTEPDDVIKWKHFPRYWPSVRGIHRSPVNSPHKGQRRGALMFSLVCVRINGWVNNGEAGDLRRHRAHYDVIVMNFSNLLNGLRACIHVSKRGPGENYWDN